MTAAARNPNGGGGMGAGLGVGPGRVPQCQNVTDFNILIPVNLFKKLPDQGVGTSGSRSKKNPVTRFEILGPSGWFKGLHVGDSFQVVSERW